MMEIDSVSESKTNQAAMSVVLVVTNVTLIAAVFWFNDGVRASAAAAAKSVRQLSSRKGSTARVAASPQGKSMTRQLSSESGGSTSPTMSLSLEVWCWMEGSNKRGWSLESTRARKASHRRARPHPHRTSGRRKRSRGGGSHQARYGFIWNGTCTCCL